MKSSFDILATNTIFNSLQGYTLVAKFSYKYKDINFSILIMFYRKPKVFRNLHFQIIELLNSTRMIWLWYYILIESIWWWQIIDARTEGNTDLMFKSVTKQSNCFGGYSVSIWRIQSMNRVHLGLYSPLFKDLCVAFRWAIAGTVGSPPPKKLVFTLLTEPFFVWEWELSTQCLCFITRSNSHMNILTVIWLLDIRFAWGYTNMYNIFNKVSTIHDIWLV